MLRIEQDEFVIEFRSCGDLLLVDVEVRTECLCDREINRDLTHQVCGPDLDKLKEIVDGIDNRS